MFSLLSAKSQNLLVSGSVIPDVILAVPLNQYQKSFHDFKTYAQPWLLWLSGLSTSPRTEKSPVPFLVRAHAWVASQAPIWGCARINLSLLLSLTPALPPSLKINK